MQSGANEMRKSARGRLAFGEEKEGEGMSLSSPADYSVWRCYQLLRLVKLLVLGGKTNVYFCRSRSLTANLVKFASINSEAEIICICLSVVNLLHYCARFKPKGSELAVHIPCFLKHSRWGSLICHTVLFDPLPSVTVSYLRLPLQKFTPTQPQSSE